MLSGGIAGTHGRSPPAAAAGAAAALASLPLCCARRRESFFGGPLSTREQAKAPGWSAFVKAAPAPEKELGKGAKGRSAGGSGAKPSRQQAAPPPVDPEQERRQKLRQRRDFSGLGGNAPPPPPPAAGQQQTAAGPRQQQQQQQRGTPTHQHQRGQQQRVKVSTKRPAGGGGGRMATAARGMAMEVTALGKGRKQAASDALKQRVGEMVAQGRGGSPAAAGLGSPTGSGTAGAGGGAAAAARAAREAAGAKAIMQNKPVRTATGMQTLQLVSRPLAQGRGGAAGAGGGAALAAMRAGVAGSGSSSRGGAVAAGASPESVTKAPRPVTGAGAPRRLQQQRPGGAAGRPQFRGAFYGGRQPPAALEARMHYNKRRCGQLAGCIARRLSTSLRRCPFVLYGVLSATPPCSIGRQLWAAVPQSCSARWVLLSGIRAPQLLSLVGAALRYSSPQLLRPKNPSAWCRLSLDDAEDLESFIASDDEEGEGWASDGGAGGEDWRAALREATGG